jgi:3'-5' exoribonuclease
MMNNSDKHTNYSATIEDWHDFLQIPAASRLVSNSISTNLETSGTQAHYATLYGNGKELAVQWSESIGSPLIHGHPLVKIIPRNLSVLFDGGAVLIDQLETLKSPPSSINIFSTALPSWFDNLELRDKAIVCWNWLDEKNRLLLNSLLHDDAFLKRFCEGPSSTSNHHAYRNGNLEHTIEVIHIATLNCLHVHNANYQLALIFAWLHDIGKADEYQCSNSPDKKYKLTSTGYLHGHQMTGFYKLLEARTKYAPKYPEASFNHLRHLMTARMSSDPLNYRNAQMIEYDLVQLADILSAKGNLHSDAFCGLPFGKHPFLGNGKTPNYRYEL